MESLRKRKYVGICPSLDATVVDCRANTGLLDLTFLLQMIIVGLKPSPQTQYKYVKPKPAGHLHQNAIATASDPSAESVESEAESLSGCLAWLPVMKLGGAGQNKSGKCIYGKLL
jgi:vacuolar protein sorting-associated protein 8